MDLMLRAVISMLIFLIPSFMLLICIDRDNRRVIVKAIAINETLAIIVTLVLLKAAVSLTLLIVASAELSILTNTILYTDSKNNVSTRHSSVFLAMFVTMFVIIMLAEALSPLSPIWH